MAFDNMGPWRAKPTNEMDEDELDEVTMKIAIGSNGTSTPLASGANRDQESITLNEQKKNELIKRALVNSTKKLLDAHETIDQLALANETRTNRTREGRGDNETLLAFKMRFDNIPEYDGQPESLRNFSRYLRRLVEQYGPGVESQILEILPGKLKGRAKLMFGRTAYKHDTVEGFLREINLQFESTIDPSLCLIELKQLDQKVGEPVTDFWMRVQELEDRLVAIYEASEETSEEQKNFQCERVMEESLEAFLCGLKNPPEYRVRSRNPQNLTEAVNCAKHLESREKIKAISDRAVVRATQKVKSRDWEDTESSSSASTVDLANLLTQLIGTNQNVRAINATETCRKCRRAGHSESECNRDKMCLLCRRQGHDLSSCWQLLESIETNALTEQTLRNLNQPLNRGAQPINNQRTPSMLAPEYMNQGGNVATPSWPTYPPMTPWPMPNYNNNYRKNYSRNNWNNQPRNTNYGQYNRGNTNYRSREEYYSQNRRNFNNQFKGNNYNNNNGEMERQNNGRPRQGYNNYNGNRDRFNNDNYDRERQRSRDRSAERDREIRRENNRDRYDSRRDEKRDDTKNLNSK